MKYLLRILLVSLPLLSITSALYPQRFNLTFCGEDYPDQEIVLAHRFGSRFFSDDTVRTGPDGCASFFSKEKLPEGMYQLVFTNNRFIEFFLTDNQEFSIKLPKGAPIEQVEFLNSEENSQFFEWQMRMGHYQSEMGALQRSMRQSNLSPDSIRYIQSRYEQVQKAAENLWDAGIKALTGTLPGDFIKGMKPMEIPINLPGQSPENQKLLQYRYYINHFFDAVDLTDSRLLRTPLIESKLNLFFKRAITPVPDSIIPAVERVIAMTGREGETYQFTVQHLLNLYSEPEIMGTDAVYVYMAENYYLNGNASWVDEQNLNEIQWRVNELKPLLIGSPAPPLVKLVNPEGQTFDLTEIKARFVIIYFWESECGHCKESTPKLHEMYPMIRSKGGEILAIYTRLEPEPWKAFIKENNLTWINAYTPQNINQIIDGYQAWSTPKIFVLSEDFKIIAKDLTIDQLEPLIDHYLSEERQN